MASLVVGLSPSSMWVMILYDAVRACPHAPDSGGMY